MLRKGSVIQYLIFVSLLPATALLLLSPCISAVETEPCTPYSRSYLLSDSEMAIYWYKVDECILIPDHLSGKYQYIGIACDTGSLSYRSGVVYLSNTDPGALTQPGTFMKIKEIPVDSLFDSGIVSVYTPDDLGMKMEIRYVRELLAQDTDPESPIAAGYYREEAEYFGMSALRGLRSEGWPGERGNRIISGDPAEAFGKSIELFGRALTIIPDYDSFCRRGILYLLVGEEDMALSDFRRAIELYPGNRIALSELWRIHYRRGEYEDALKYIRALIETGIEDAESLYRLARTYHSALDYDMAIHFYERAAGLEPDHLNSHWNLGRLHLFVRADFDSAVRHLRESARLNEEYVGNHYLLGLALWHAGSFDSAAASLERAIEIEPMHLEANLLMAEILLHKKNDHIGAIGRLRAALKADPHNIEALMMMASCYEAEGGYEEALQWLNMAESRVVGLITADSDAEYEPGEEAMPVEGSFLSGIGCEPGAIYSKRAEIYLKMDRREEALSDYRRSYDFAYNEEESLRKLIGISSEAGEYALALEYSRRLLTCIPEEETEKRSGIYRDMAWYYLIIGDYISSLEMSLSSVELNESPLSRFYASLAYIGQGDNWAGLSEMLDALSLLSGRDDPEYRDIQSRLATLINMGLVPESAMLLFEYADIILE